MKTVRPTTFVNWVRDRKARLSCDGEIYTWLSPRAALMPDATGTVVKQDQNRLYAIATYTVTPDGERVNYESIR